MGSPAADPLGLADLLPLIAGLLVAYYAVRIAAAALLLALSTRRPGLRGAALVCAPAALRPLLRRAIAGGVVGVALSSGAALASTPPCPAPAPVPVLDRAAVCAAVGEPSPSPTSSPPPAPDAPERSEAGRTVPDQAEAAPASDRAAAPVGSSSHYTVQQGDSLWAITAGLLGPTAADAEVARAWPQLWAANKPVIGADPGRILPGTTLEIPSQLRDGGTR